MGQGGGVVLKGERLLPPGFISTGCGGGAQRSPDVKLDCGCHTTPWVEGEGFMDWSRQYHLCPMHDMQGRRKAVVRRVVDDMDAAIRMSHVGRVSGGLSMGGRMRVGKIAMKSLGWGS